MTVLKGLHLVVIVDQQPLNLKFFSGVQEIARFFLKFPKDLVVSHLHKEQTYSTFKWAFKNVEVRH